MNERSLAQPSGTIRRYVQDAAGDQPSTADEIVKLAVLRDQGAIYEQEFAHATAKLLGTPSPTGPSHVVDIPQGAGRSAGKWAGGLRSDGRRTAQRTAQTPGTPRYHPQRMIVAKPVGPEWVRPADREVAVVTEVDVDRSAQLERRVRERAAPKPPPAPPAQVRRNDKRERPPRRGR